jgi:hypothetical protein
LAEEGKELLRLAIVKLQASQIEATPALVGASMEILVVKY